MERNYDRKLKVDVSLEERNKSNKEREKLTKKLYLGEIIEKEKPQFTTNNLILSPVGSGKSFLIEEKLIPKDYKGTILYLTSNTALKDSLAPDNNELRKEFAENNKSKGFFTSQNKKRYGNVPYKVHVMTYHEFGKRIYLPNEEFTKDIDLIFCDEIHSLPIFTQYGGNGELLLALKWLFQKHEGKTIFYFTATKEGIDNLERRAPGYISNVKMFDYLNHPKIRKYQVRSTYYIANIKQLNVHLRAKREYVEFNLSKGLAFTKKIENQEKIAEIAKEEGYNPIVLWSINNQEKEMTKTQLEVRDYLLKTGNIPEPYNLLIINGSMQEGWNLHDRKVEFAILDTMNETEKVQALGRIRKDIDFLLLKTEKEIEDKESKIDPIILNKKYLNIPLLKEDKEKLSLELEIKNERGNIVKWNTVKKVLVNSGYKVEDSIRRYNGKRKAVSIITNNSLN